ncbi:MAG TPA: permease-like cell division protein FtsX [Mycobacteriales bacterium]|jgi:cell division transport system permease protein|nr:permease-like cell division protein FtsX [Mycobacteriales bacterium]
MRVRTVASEAVLGLRRNLVMSVAAVVTVAVSLAFVGTAFLVTKTVTDIRKIFYTQIEISIFLDEDVTPPQRDEINQTLSRLPLVQSVVYESKAEAYRRFQLQFQDQPDLLANVTEEALPESYRVKLRDPTQYDVVASAVEDLPGVGQVVDYRKFLDDLFAVLDGLRTTAIAVALVQLVAATLLIGNTVRVAAFSRRRETGVMRLVGATRLYIQLPFLLEGVVAGLLGAGIAVGLLFLGKALVLDRTLRSLFRSGVIPAVTDNDIWMITPYLLLLGVVISGLASLVTLQRYIRI